MSFLKEKLRVVLRAMLYPESWMLPPRVTWAMLKSLPAIRPATAATGTIFYVNTPPVESQAFRRYLHGLRRMAHGESVPLTVHISVTDRCGSECLRCSNKLMRAERRQDPTRESVIGLLRDLKEAGTVSVAFTGGEPTLREDLCQLVEACCPEIAPLLFTSGQAVHAKLVRSLRSAGLAMAAVSLDSHDEEAHDAVRGKAGAFQRAVLAIRCFLEAGIYTAVQAVADTGLLSVDGRLNEFLRFCNGLGVHEVIFLDPMTPGKSHGVGGLSETERKQLWDLHLRSASDPSMPKVTTAAFLESPEYLGCLAGYSFFYVNSAGDLFPCDFAPVSFGNVFESGFGPLAQRAKSVINQPCSKCLWTQIAKTSGLPGQLPASWEQTKELLSRFDHGKPARIMDLMSSSDGARQ